MSPYKRIKKGVLLSAQKIARIYHLKVILGNDILLAISKQITCWYKGCLSAIGK